MSRFAIRTPYFIVVACLIVAILGVVSVSRMPVDMFPSINIPVVVVATFYSGMPPEQVENSITYRLERFLTLGSGIEHIESRSLTGVSIIKVFFHPGTNPDAAVAMVGGLATAEMSRLPPGTLPPVVLKFDASSLPVCLLTLGGEGLSETQLKDVAQNVIRNQLAGVPGASVPQPFGGRGRQMMLYADPFKLEAHQLSLMDVVRTIGESNVILPAGDVQIGRFDYNIYTNSMLGGVADINQVPLKMVGQSPVRVSDIGEAKDAQTLQYNIVRVNGQRSVYLPILKQGGDSNTIEVVDGIRKQGPKARRYSRCARRPRSFSTSREFVKSAIETLLHEGALGLFLTSLMILVFLGSMRATRRGLLLDSAFRARHVHGAAARRQFDQHDGARRPGAGAFAPDRQLGRRAREHLPPSGDGRAARSRGRTRRARSGAAGARRHADHGRRLLPGHAALRREQVSCSPRWRWPSCSRCSRPMWSR